jgi:hypothetical protein
MATRKHSRPGGNRPRTHPSPTPAPSGTRSARLGARKARSVKPSATPRRKPTASKPPRLPPAIEIALDDQRSSLEIAISLLYCLHATLRYQDEGASLTEGEAVDDAAEMADPADVTALLLVRLNSVHTALESTELVKANVDPETVRLTEMARELGTGSNEQEAP